MKKILFLSAVALALMACGGNNAEMSSKDKKALNATTIQAVAQFGQSVATVEKAILDAGFEKIDIEYFEMFYAPKRMAGNKFKASKKEDYEELFYMYNLDLEDIDTEEGVIKPTKQNEILKKGKAIILACAIFVDGKLVELNTSALMAAKSGAHKNYLNVSDELHKQIPEKAAMVEWGGSTEHETYEDYAEYAAYIVAAEGKCNAEEMCYVITKMSDYNYEGYMYFGAYAYPAYEDQIEWQAKDGYDPFVTTAFAIADMANF